MWIVPNDAWFFNRDRLAHDDKNFVSYIKDWTLGIIDEGEKLITDNDFSYHCTPKWDIIGSKSSIS